MSARAALLVLLRERVTTLDGIADATTEVRYAVLHITPGALSADDVAGRYDLLQQRFQVTSVGTSSEQAEWVADRSRDALLGVVPRLDGWQCGPISAYEPEPIQPDRDRPDRVLFFTTCSYVFHAARL